METALPLPPGRTDSGAGSDVRPAKLAFPIDREVKEKGFCPYYIRILIL